MLREPLGQVDREGKGIADGCGGVLGDRRREMAIVVDQGEDSGRAISGAGSLPNDEFHGLQRSISRMRTAVWIML
jgi:hypothetical protein